MLLHDGLELGSQGLDLEKPERGGLIQLRLHDLLLIVSSDHGPGNKSPGLLSCNEILLRDPKGQLGVQL